MKDRKSLFIVLAILLIIIFAGVMFFRGVGTGSIITITDEPDTTSSEASEYQAVFLSINNQLFFGKVSGQNSQFVTLRDVYYIQIDDSDIDPLGEDVSFNNPNISLIKLGGEIHGPTDEMRINRDHIVLIEDLRENSRVVQAIRNFKAQQSEDN